MVFNIDMVDDSIVSNIIYNDSDKKDKVRGHSSASSMYSSRSLSVFLNKSTKKYVTKVQYESESIDQDNPIVPFDSS